MCSDSSLLQCVEVVYGTLIHLNLTFHFYQNRARNIKVVPLHTVWTYGGVELELNLFLISKLDRGKIQHQIPAALTLGREPPLSIHCAMERP